MLGEGDHLQRVRDHEEHFAARLDALLDAELVAGVRHVGLWAGVDVSPALGRTGREVCERMRDRGVLAKETHGSTLRLSPPLTITGDELDHGLDALTEALRP